MADTTPKVGDPVEVDPSVAASIPTPAKKPGQPGFVGPTAPKTVQDYLAEFGQQLAFINSDPDLQALFNRAMSENWTAARWTQEYESNYLPKHDSSFVSYQQAKFNRPAEFATQYNNLLDQMQIIAKSQGFDVSSWGGHITAEDTKTIDPNTNPVAYLLQHYYNGVPTAIAQQYIANHSAIAKSGGNVVGGTLADNANTLRSYAKDMGVSSLLLTPTWQQQGLGAGTDYFEGAAAAIAQGKTTLQAEQNYYRQQAMNVYKPFAQQIKDGATVSQLANPYTSTLANLLEVSPDSIDLASPTGYGNLVTKALQGDGTNSMSLDAFTQQVKQRPEWLNTSNARNSMMDTAYSLLRNFGLVTG